MSEETKKKAKAVKEETPAPAPTRADVVILRQGVRAAGFVFARGVHATLPLEIAKHKEQAGAVEITRIY